MGNVDNGIQRAIILWLPGVGLADILPLGEVEALMKQGVLIELLSSPITGPQAQQYQAFSGRLPVHFGFFDTLMPLCRLPRPQQGINGYTIIEEYAGRDVAPKMLPDLLRAAGWGVDYEDISPGELLNSLRRLAQTQSSEAIC